MYKDSATRESSPRRFYELSTEERGRALEHIALDVLFSLDADGTLPMFPLRHALPEAVRAGNLRGFLTDGLEFAERNLRRLYATQELTEEEEVSVRDTVVHRLPQATLFAKLYIPLTSLLFVTTIALGLNRSSQSGGWTLNLAGIIGALLTLCSGALFVVGYARAKRDRQRRLGQVLAFIRVLRALLAT